GQAVNYLVIAGNEHIKSGGASQGPAQVGEKIDVGFQLPAAFPAEQTPGKAQSGNQQQGGKGQKAFVGTFPDNPPYGQHNACKSINNSDDLQNLPVFLVSCNQVFHTFLRFRQQQAA